jgi:hypothetical protein
MSLATHHSVMRVDVRPILLQQHTARIPNNGAGLVALLDAYQNIIFSINTTMIASHIRSELKRKSCSVPIHHGWKIVLRIIESPIVTICRSVGFCALCAPLPLLVKITFEIVVNMCQTPRKPKEKDDPRLGG